MIEDGSRKDRMGNITNEIKSMEVPFLFGLKDSDFATNIKNVIRDRMIHSIKNKCVSKTSF